MLNLPCVPRNLAWPYVTWKCSELKIMAQMKRTANVDRAECAGVVQQMAAGSMLERPCAGV